MFSYRVRNTVFGRIIEFKLECRKTRTLKDLILESLPSTLMDALLSNECVIKHAKSLCRCKAETVKKMKSILIFN